MDFIAALRLPPGASVALYAGELPTALSLPAAIARLDTCVIGISYRGTPVMLFSCPRDAMTGLERTIQPALDEAVGRYLPAPGRERRDAARWRALSDQRRSRADDHAD